MSFYEGERHDAFTDSSSRWVGSHSSYATRLRSEHELNTASASGWKTERMVVSLTEMMRSVAPLRRRRRTHGEYVLPLRIIRAIQRISLGVAREYNWTKIRFTLSLLMLVVVLIVKMGLTILIQTLRARLTTRLADQCGGCFPLRSISLPQFPIVLL